MTLLRIWLAKEQRNSSLLVIETREDILGMWKVTIMNAFLTR